MAETTESYQMIAESGNFKPFAAISIESPDNVVFPYTEQADWEGSDELVSIDTTSLPGSVLPKYSDFTVESNNGTVPAWVLGFLGTGSTDTVFNSPADVVVNFFKCNALWYVAAGNTDGVKSTTCQIRTGSGGGPIIATSLAVNIDYYPNLAPSFESIGLGLNDHAYQFIFPGGVNLTGGVQYYITFAVVGVAGLIHFLLFAGSTVPASIPDGIYYLGQSSDDIYLITSEIDIGSIPVDDVLFSAFDFREAGTTIDYFYQGKDLPGDPFTAFVLMVDGDLISPFQIYRIKIQFDANDPEVRPQTDEITLSKNAFLTISTHKNQPSVGTAGLLTSGSVTPIAGKIEFLKPGRIGELNFDLPMTPEISNLISTGFLRNKAVRGRAGFVGLSEADAVDYFVGLWSNFDLKTIPPPTGERAAQGIPMVSVSTLGAQKFFNKAYIPREQFNTATNLRETVPFSVVDTNALTVIRMLMDQASVQDRYIDNTLADILLGVGTNDTLDPRFGELDSPDFEVTRDLDPGASVGSSSSSKLARDLINELAQVLGIFFFELANGRLTFSLYQPEVETDLVFDGRYQDFGQIKGNQDKLHIKQFVYYLPKVGVSDPGESDDDYQKAVVYTDEDLDRVWQEDGEKKWYDKWSMRDNAAVMLAVRMADWFSQPFVDTSVKNCGPIFIDNQRGDIAKVNNLLLPYPTVAYDPATAYNRFDRRVYSGRIYEALIGDEDILDNVGNQPDISPQYWDDLGIKSTGMTDGRKFLIRSDKIRPLGPQIDFDDLREIPNWYQYFPDSYTLVRGTYIAGDVDDLVIRTDDCLEIGELVGSPGSEIIFHFVGVKGVPKRVEITYIYTGHAGHTINAELKNQETVVYTVLGTLPDDPDVGKRHYGLKELIINKDAIAYVTPGGGMDLKINHISPGNAEHRQCFYKIRIITRGA